MTLIPKEKSVPFDNGRQRSDGQYERYAVLPEAERAKGFVRPVRKAYRHLGLAHPSNPLRDLTAEEKERYAAFGYVKYEEYPPDEESNVVGKFWTQHDLDRIGAGCNTVTSMPDAIAETYARDPSYYGATMCCRCRKHLPVQEFVWEGTLETVGS